MDYQHYQWDWNANIFTIPHDTQFVTNIWEIAQSHQGLLSLTDILQMSSTWSNWRFLWNALYSIIGILAALAVATGIFIVVSH